MAQTQPETLAHHLTEAGVIDRAIGYWLQAGKNAAMRSANLEAIAHVRRRH
jgi:predicted ATPase